MDRPDDLIQRVLEGTATAEERARLDAAAAADPDLRKRREELEHVFRVLGSARLAPSPPELRDAVLREIREQAPARAGSARVPTPARPGSRDIPWGRLLFPITAALCAVALLWAARGPWSDPSGRTAGTMAGALEPLTVTLGGGPAAVRFEATPAAGGFRIEVRGGDVPAEVELTALDPAVRLATSSGRGTDAPDRLRQVLQPRGHWTVQGIAATREAPVRVHVRFVDGRSASATVRIPATPEVTR